MPFTLAHPAAVLPLMRRPLDGLALVCGAMAPDIPYFVRSTPLRVTAQSWYEPFTNATTSHSIAGLLPVALVWALVLYLMLLAAKPPVLWLVQGGGQADTLGLVRASRHQTRDEAGPALMRWAWVPVSLLIGVLTHLVWDSFASSDGFLAQNVDAMNRTFVGDLTWIRSVQHLSTVLGLLVVAIAIHRRQRAATGHGDVSLRMVSWSVGVLMVVGLVGGIASVLVTLEASDAMSTRDRVEGILAATVTGGGAAVAVAAVVSTASWWLFQLLRGRQETASVE